MKKIVILGAGESGKGSAILARKNSYEVFVSDNGLIDMETKKKFNGLNIDFEENSHELAKCTDIDFVIKSPGISDDLEIIDFYRNNRIKVISEIEFGPRILILTPEINFLAPGTNFDFRQGIADF